MNLYFKFECRALSGLNIEVPNASVIDNNNGGTMMWTSLYKTTGTLIDKKLKQDFLTVLAMKIYGP